MIVLAKLNLPIISAVFSASAVLSIAVTANQSNWIIVGIKTPINLGERQRIPLKTHYSKFRLKGLNESERTEIIEKHEFLVLFIKVPEKIDEWIIGRKRHGLIGGKRDTRYWQFPVYNGAPLTCRSDSILYKQLKDYPLVITKY